MDAHRPCTRRLRTALLSLPALALCLMLARPAQASAEAGWVLDRSSRAATTLEHPEAQAVTARFAAAYAAAGRPRVALFWNHELTDQVSLQQRETAHLHAHALRDGRALSISSSKGTETERPATRSTTLLERDLWQVETEFSQRLLDAGVELMDRAAILRITAQAVAGGRPADRQSLEVSALQGKAELLLEVLLTPDPAAPLGWGFRSNLKDVKSGRVLSTQYLSAMPPLPRQGEASFRAGAKGYQRVEPEPVTLTLRMIGTALAIDALADLSRRLPREPIRR